MNTETIKTERQKIHDAICKYFTVELEFTESDSSLIADALTGERVPYVSITNYNDR